MTKKAFCLNGNDFIPKITAEIVSNLIKKGVLPDNENLAHLAVEVIMDTFTEYFDKQSDENGEVMQ